MNGHELRNGLDELPFGDPIVSCFVGNSKRA